MNTVQLSHSFRWTTSSQHDLAGRLHAGLPVALPEASGGDEVNVAIGSRWQPLWRVGVGVLPLAFDGFKGDIAEAAETLLLGHVTRNAFGMYAVYLRDALSRLAISDSEAPRLLRPGLQEVADMLRSPGNQALDAANRRLSAAIGAVSPRVGSSRYVCTGMFSALAARLRHPVRLVPGLTAHQAKGCEWDTVGVYLEAGDHTALAGGLSVTAESHRQLHVACTRARSATLLIGLAWMWQVSRYMPRLPEL
jgi:DNA helicase II / ATP-dependent DNA helicase PcrA